ncbi:MAG: carboxypeptidase regulatory-like domain-containing protein [Planctomycetota bacterium]
MGRLARTGWWLGVGLAVVTAGAGPVAHAGGGKPAPAPPAAPPAATGIVSGTVTDDDGKPLAGATVRVHREGTKEPWTTTSDAKGFYSVRGLPPGDARVVVRARGRVTVEGAVKVPTTGLALFDAKLVQGVRYAGRVVNLRGEAVARARVTAKEDRESRSSFFAALSRETDAVESGADGAFALDGLEPGARYVVVVRHPRYLPAELPGLDGSAGGGVEGIEVLLEDAAWVSGTVTDEAGKPLAGVRIASPDVDDPGWRELDLGGVTVRVYIGGDADDLEHGPTKARTDARGRFELGSLPPTEAGRGLRLRARAPGFFPGELKLEGLVAGAERKDVVFRLAAGTAVVAGVVVDDRDQPVAGARVMASADDAGAIGSAVTDAAGRFRFDRVATKEKVDLRVRADGHEPGGAADVAPDTKDAKVTVRRLGRLKVRVLGADGKPVPRVRVVVRMDAREENDDGETDDYAQGADGLDLPLPVGALSVVVSAEGYAEAVVGDYHVEPGQRVEAPPVTLAKP